MFVCQFYFALPAYAGCSVHGYLVQYHDDIMTFCATISLHRILFHLRTYIVRALWHPRWRTCCWAVWRHRHCILCAVTTTIRIIIWWHSAYTTSCVRILRHRLSHISYIKSHGDRHGRGRRGRQAAGARRGGRAGWWWDGGRRRLLPSSPPSGTGLWLFSFSSPCLLCSLKPVYVYTLLLLNYIHGCLA